MRREQWEHVIAAAASVSGEYEFVVIRSQAILGPFPDAPDAMLRSQEADLYPSRSRPAAHLARTDHVVRGTSRTASGQRRRSRQAGGNFGSSRIEDLPIDVRQRVLIRTRLESIIAGAVGT
jgi:hypothetical protein